MALSRDSQYFQGTPNISGTGKATNVKFTTHIQRESLTKILFTYFSRKKGVALSRDSQYFQGTPDISGTSKATKVKFSSTIQRFSLSKSS